MSFRKVFFINWTDRELSRRMNDMKQEPETTETILNSFHIIREYFRGKIYSLNRHQIQCCYTCHFLLPVSCYQNRETASKLARLFLPSVYFQLVNTSLYFTQHVINYGIIHAEKNMILYIQYDPSASTVSRIELTL